MREIFSVYAMFVAMAAASVVMVFVSLYMYGVGSILLLWMVSAAMFTLFSYFEKQDRRKKEARA